VVAGYASLTRTTPFVRIYGHPNYPGGPGSPAEAMAELIIFRHRRGLRLIPDDVSLTESSLFNQMDKVTPRQLTDLYLLGLSVKHGLKFVTMDDHIPAQSISGGLASLMVIRTTEQVVT